jgi:hypothetical protein
VEIGTRVLVDIGPYKRWGVVRGTGQVVSGLVDHVIIVEIEMTGMVHCLPATVWDASVIGDRPRFQLSTAVGYA